MSGQRSTCDLGVYRDSGSEWSYVKFGGRVITAGMPAGPNPETALESFLQWCRRESLQPMIFGCEAPDLSALAGWSLTEIGRQPLFLAGPDFRPDLSGPKQPEKYRELRRQARRSLSKQVKVQELTVPELWSLSHSSVLKKMLYHRWEKRRLAEFSFLVEFHLEMGVAEKRAFAARSEHTGRLLGLVVLTPSQRGWLLEHQVLDPEAPNGTAELILCKILSENLPPGTWLSLGVTPLYSELQANRGSDEIPGVLSFIPTAAVDKLLSYWEPLYGFRKLLAHRRRLRPDSWEPVYWAVPQKRTVSDVLLVLRAFSGGSFVGFAWDTVEKQLQLLSRRLAPRVFPLLNQFYVVTLLFWIPVLWALDGLQLFGNPDACKVWAIYDFFLVGLFALHQRTVRRGASGFVTDLLLGMVTADTVLAWIQTALYHGGLPDGQPLLAALLVIINTAPLTAVVFLILVKFASKPLPFLRRELPVA